jgi:diaminohydroxyphosphoribosylaminopyrimidine deaminase/5-amino-6-(5-phosphoribosylamino)uracil reductase
MLSQENPYVTGSDEYFMHEALALAQGGMGWASPNPLVGCVLTRDGQTIGRGFHAHNGQRHAEVQALLDAGDAAGATAYVSLEPCSHVGRQPSCCHELARAGVTRVVWGARDVDPRSAGRADKALHELGVSATGRALIGECDRFLDYYLSARSQERCFAHLKLALSLDSKLACATGHSQWLSGPQSHGYAHYLRLKYDAVLVGYRTVLADNPRLTVRSDVLAGYRGLNQDWRLRQPVRVVLDPRGELLPQLAGLALARTEEGEFREQLPRLILVCAGDHAPAELSVPYAQVICPKTDAGRRLIFADLFDKLFALGVHSVLIEGGGGLAAELIRQQAADKLTLVYTPRLIGADGIGWTPELNCREIADCPRISTEWPQILGNDVILEGKPVWLP